MLLEDLYNNNLGKCTLYIKSIKGESHFIPMNFHDYANTAFEYTVADIQLFENSKNIVFIGKNSVYASSFWFLSIEAFTNTILKYLCYDNSDSFSQFKGKGINARIKKINEYISLPQKEFSTKFPQAKLYEFEDFRNEIFHDRSLEEEKVFNKTLFSPKPNLQNLAAELQSLLISIDFFNYYRFCIKGIDFMPSIRLKVSNSIIFEKLDTIYDILLKPTVIQSLKKHQLETNLSFDSLIAPCEVVYTPKRFLPNPLIKAIIDKDIDIKLNEEETDFFYRNFSSMINNRKSMPSPGNFETPNYIKKN